jgi:hypothetical protein
MRGNIKETQMPSNFKVIKYVLGFENSNFLSFDFQYNIIESAKNLYCSKGHFWEYKTLDEAIEAITLIKNKAKNIPGFCFYSIDDHFTFDEVVEGKTDDDFHIELPNDEEGCRGCKYLKLPFTLDDFKIFAREVEITYKNITNFK